MKKSTLVPKLLQLIMVIVITSLMFQIFLLANTIQGTGKVINYTGIIRGATQRLVKLELANQPDDDLIQYLDQIFIDLQEQRDGTYQLDKLSDEDYLNKLNKLSQKWDGLKKEIRNYRVNKDLETPLVNQSELYFFAANEVVSAAEYYSERQVHMLRILEIILSIGLLYLILFSLQQTIKEVRLIRKNNELSVAAYLDKLTGIPGRRSCEEVIWYPADLTRQTYCVIMFDLNNLKVVNDQYGHQAGDIIIKAFAEVLYKFSRENVFVGRYGGDEFLMVIHDYDEATVQILLGEIEGLISEHNSKNELQIHFASGYEYGGDSLYKMLEKADEKMYQNKKRMKDKQEL